MAANTAPRPPLTPAQKRVIKVVVTIIGALGLASFGQAFTAVSGWAYRNGFIYPWADMLPLILDGAVVASLIGAVLFTSLNMHRWWMHFVSAGLAFPTIYLNWNAGSTQSSSVAHAAVAAVYIVFAEIGQWALRSWMRREGILPHDVIRGSRWLVAPVQTCRIKMRMIKWEISSYAEALDAEKQRLRAVATARREFGRRWRTKIGGDVRLGLSLGEITAEDIKALTSRLATERRDTGAGTADPGQARDTGTPPAPPSRGTTQDSAGHAARDSRDTPRKPSRDKRPAVPKAPADPTDDATVTAAEDAALVTLDTEMRKLGRTVSSRSIYDAKDRLDIGDTTKRRSEFLAAYFKSLDSLDSASDS
jgi:hypothetical protein